MNSDEHAEPVLLDATDPTFADLKAERRKLAATGQSPPVTANDRTALTRFMQAHGFSDASPIVPAMSEEADYLSNLRRFEEMATSDGIEGRTLAASSIAGYRSRLGAWHEAAAILGARSALPAYFPAALQRAVRSYLARYPEQSRRTIADGAGMPMETLWRWCPPPGMSRTVGMLPRAVQVSLNRIAKLEDVLELPSGALSSKLLNRRTRSGERGKGDRAQRQLLPRDHLHQIPFHLKELPQTFQAFFAAYEAYNTSAAPPLNAGGQRMKRSGGRWRADPRGGESATGKLVRRWLCAILGWLTLPDTLEGAREYVLKRCRWKSIATRHAEALAPMFVGRGMAPEDLRICHIVDPDIVGPYLDWRKRRAGSDSNYPRLYLANARALIQPDRGFLRQQVELAWDYPKVGIQPIKNPLQVPEEYLSRSRDWGVVCKDWHEALADISLGVDKKAKARNPRTALQPIFDHPSPMAVVIGMIRSHENSKPAGRLEADFPGRKRLAVWWRDQMLLRMMVSNPLRNRNYREMTWRRDGRGNLYNEKRSGAWRLRFDPADFKNERGAASQPYDVEIPSDVSPFIETYLNEARPLLLLGKPETDVVFVSRFGNVFNVDGISSLLWDITGGNIDPLLEMSGFRSHAFRHIIATAWLRANPGDYLTVARILHDNLDTVLKNYDHSSPDHGLRRYTAWLRREMETR